MQCRVFSARKSLAGGRGRDAFDTDTVKEQEREEERRRGGRSRAGK